MKFVVALLALACGFAPRSSSAEIQLSTGVTQSQSIPGPTRSYARVVLNVPYMAQKPWHCVPTSAAMILAYYGRGHDPDDLKKRAEDYKPQVSRNVQFTLWRDMLHALKEIGERWEIRDYPKTPEGFRKGLDDIKDALRSGNPVMIDVHLDAGHTFVLIGFDDTQKVVFIRDPALRSTESRVLSYDVLEGAWHNHRFGPERSAFFARP